MPLLTAPKTQNAKITDKEKKIRLSIVKFADDSKDEVGNEIHWGINYSQIVKDLTVCEDNGAAELTTAVNDIRPHGATRADYGLQHAQTELTKHGRTMPKRSSSSLPMARLINQTGLTMTLLPKRLERLNPSRRQVPRFTRSAFLRMLTRRPMSAKLQKKTSSCRRSPATTPLLPTRKRAS